MITDRSHIPIGTVVNLERDQQKIYYWLNKLALNSICKDTKVCCMFFTNEGMLISYGFNNVSYCDGGCLSKAGTCKVTHAEVDVLHNTSKEYLGKGNIFAYLNNFPCVDCQIKLVDHVQEIRAFRKPHVPKLFENIKIMEVKKEWDVK